MPLADETALGLLETHGLVAGIEAADAMLKTAEVRLVSIEQTVPALITIKIVGEVAAVQASVDAGRAAAERIGKVISAHVIPRPAGEVRAMMQLDAEVSPRGSDPQKARPNDDSSASGRSPANAGPPGSVASAESSTQERSLNQMTVPELRALAREIPDFPIQGRDVARARKAELIEQIRQYREG